MYKRITLWLWILAFALPASALEVPGIHSKPAVGLVLEPVNAEFQKAIADKLTGYFDANKRESISGEREFLVKVLRSEGYYAARIRLEEDEAKQRSKLGRIYHIETGTRATIAAIKLRYPQQLAPPDTSQLPFAIGDPLRAQAILDGQGWLQGRAQKDYCLLNTRVTYRVMIDPENQAATVIFRLAKSEDGFFRNIHINGNTGVKNTYLRKRISFKEGDCYDPGALDRTRVALLRTNLIYSANFASQVDESQEDAQGRRPVDVRIDVIERQPRTIKAGVAYGTDTKFGSLLGWEHRNLFGEGEKLAVDLELNNLRKALTAQFTRPDFLVDDQTITYTLTAIEETTDSYSSVEGQSRVEINRRLNNHLVLSGGLSYTKLEVSDTADATNGEHYDLLSLPFGLEMDFRNSLLDATKGWWVHATAQPFRDLYSEDIQFLKNALAVALYWTPVKRGSFQPTLAAKFDMGSISGASLEAVPKPERFYVGGGGSVRGYRYQSVGEYVDGEAKGGKSFGTFSMELRNRFAGNWGLVLFADGGYAYPGEMPSYGEDFLWGAGFGISYLTSFAPLRFDIGLPLEKRAGIDNDFQFYLSIGQTF